MTSTFSKIRLQVVAPIFAALYLVGGVILFGVLIGIRINTSHSMPVGFYEIKADDGISSIRRGDIVTLCLAGPGEDLAVQRQYIEPGVCMIKRIDAVPGDKLDMSKYPRLKADHAGRSLPDPHLPAVVPAGKYLAIGDASPRSYDSRYFGLIDRSEIKHVVEPLLVNR